MNRDWIPIAVALACGASVTALLIKWMSQQQMQKKIKRARDRRDATLELANKSVLQFKKTNPSIDLSPIVELSLAELTERLRAGSLRPDAVLHAYMEKALEVNKDLNCSTAVLMESLSQLAGIESYKDGLLYGVPISIKENLGYKGHDSTCGLLSKLDDPAVTDSVVVKVLKKQGAIPFIKTNVPQTLLNYECSNPIYGRTVNPHNHQKTCGGSSGGEGALIGGGGSILGVGTDIGGSIRIPASFCGICGFKPTFNRLSLRGSSSSVKGMKSALSSIGPMARDVDSLALFMKALLCDYLFALDSTVPPLPFKQEVYESSAPLRIGYYDNDSYQQPSPSMSRALQETKKLLEEAGHTLIPFRPPRVVSAIHNLMVKGALADGGTSVLNCLKGNPIDPCLRPQILPYHFPRFVKKTLSFILKPFYPRVSAVFDSISGFTSVTELWKHHVELEEYMHEVMTEWKKLELDVLLCPVLAPAYNFNYCGRLTSAASYTFLYNILNFPAGSVTVTTVTTEDEAQLRDYTGNFGDIWDKLFVKAVKDGVGLPVAVQCISLPWQDELCLRFMKEVEKLTAKNKKLK